MAAPVTVIIAWDTEFPSIFPSSFRTRICVPTLSETKPLIEERRLPQQLSKRPYFILAARALGLDCGPMSGFDADQLNVGIFPAASGR